MTLSQAAKLWKCDFYFKMVWIIQKLTLHFFVLNPFLSPISWYPIGLVSRNRERQRSRAERLRNTTLPRHTARLTSCTNVFEKTLYSCWANSACMCLARHKELLERNGTMTSHTAKPSRNQDDIGSIVAPPQVSPGHDTAWDQTCVCSDASNGMV